MSLSHPLVGCSALTLLELAREHGVEPRYWPRFASVLLLSLGFAPLRVAESWLYGSRLARADLGSQPVFIIGHWRSGTTHLHNLLALDEQFGHLSTFQATLPGCSLVGSGGFLRRLVGMLLPKTRPMDNMSMSVDGPYEEEFAVGNLSSMAVTHGMWFPRRLDSLFEQTVFFAGGRRDLVEAWKRSYRAILERVALSFPGRHLLLKNPPNTARIPVLLEMFPDAKFVHIYRNPYEVFPSTLRLYVKLMEGRELQHVERSEIERIVLHYYCRVMDSYFASRALIPARNLVEVRYEELEREPLRVLAGIYDGLGLSGFAASEPRFAAYLSTLSNYEKNRFEYTPALVERVGRSWAHTIERWGYAPPASQS